MSTDIKKTEVKPGTRIYPVPILMISSGTADGRTNIMTAGWTGTICTNPPMAYVSIRPGRVSYDMIKESGEFVLNLTTRELAAATDQCGCVSASKVPDKWEMAGLTRGKACHLEYAPIIMESPVNIECKVNRIIELGTHHMFLGDVVGVQINSEYVDDNGLFHLEDADLIAFSDRNNEQHVPQGSYVTLGETIGRYGFTVKDVIMRTH